MQVSPNGRRVFDDVVSIELKAVAGALLDDVVPSFRPTARQHCSSMSGQPSLQVRLTHERGSQLSQLVPVPE